MGTAKVTRNSIAIAIGLPIIAMISSLFSANNGVATFWSWMTSSKPPTQENFISENAQTRVADLTGQWHFATGDDMARAEPDFDDSSWDKIAVPAYWEQQGYDHHNGFAWYRRQFSIDTKELNKALFARLGRIDDTDEVFINGHRIGGLGQFPPHYFSAWDKYRTYPIPEGVIQSGANVIAVRVFDVHQGGGISDGKVGIYVSHLSQPLVNLHGEWWFKTGDNSDWKNETIDDPGFRNIHVPGVWEQQGHPHYDGYAWYRKTFDRPDVSPDETLVLLLGKIDDTDAVYLNGHQIGGTGKLDNTDRRENPEYYLVDRRYEFPASLLKQANTLAVRVHDSTGEGGIHAGPVGIMAKAEYLEYQQQLRQAGKWSFSDTVDWLLGRE